MTDSKEKEKEDRDRYLETILQDFINYLSARNEVPPPNVKIVPLREWIQITSMIDFEKSYANYKGFTETIYLRSDRVHDFINVPTDLLHEFVHHLQNKGKPLYGRTLDELIKYADEKKIPERDIVGMMEIIAEAWAKRH